MKQKTLKTHIYIIDGYKLSAVNYYHALIKYYEVRSTVDHETFNNQNHWKLKHNGVHNGSYETWRDWSREMILKRLKRK